MQLIISFCDGKPTEKTTKSINKMILDQFLQWNFSRARESQLSQKEIAAILINHEDTDEKLRVEVILRIESLQEFINTVIINDIQDKKINNKLLQEDMNKFMICIITFHNKHITQDQYNKFIEQYGSIITQQLDNYIQKHTLAKVIELLYHKDQIDSPINKFIKSNIRHKLTEIVEEKAKLASYETYGNLEQAITNINTNEEIFLWAEDKNIFSDILLKIKYQYIENECSTLSENELFEKIFSLYESKSQESTIETNLYIKNAPYNIAQIYTYIEQHKPKLLQDTKFQTDIVNMYKFKKDITSYIWTEKKEKIIKYIFSLIALFDDTTFSSIISHEFVKYNNDYSIIQTMISAIWKLNIDQQVYVWKEILKHAFKDDKIYDNNTVKEIIISISDELLKHIYDQKDWSLTAQMTYFFKDKKTLDYITPEEKNRSYIESFLTSNKNLIDFKRYITIESLQYATEDELKMIIIHEDQECRKHLLEKIFMFNREKKEKIINKISKKKQIEWIQSNPRYASYLYDIFIITKDEKIEIYQSIENTDKELKYSLFCLIPFTAQDWQLFIEQYPSKWFTMPNNIHRKSNQHSDVCYADIFRNFIKKRNTELQEKNRKSIEENLLKKLEWKFLIDLGCGRDINHVAATAYLANAKGYVWIDVNCSEECNNKQEEYKQYLIEKYKLSQDTHNHMTTLKTIFDNFDKFLDLAPSSVWYNFAINGLCLTWSSNTIKKHINRLMVPGNILIGNDIQNLNLEELIEWPYQHTYIENMMWNDGIHVIEKLETKEIILL